MGTTEWPATAQREIHPEPEFTRLFPGESQRVQKLIGEIRRISKPVLGVVERQGIYGLHFKSADAAFLHEAHFTLELRFGNSGAEPPPAHHDSRVVRRIFEGEL